MVTVTKDEYFKKMRETSKIVEKEILNYLDVYKKENQKLYKILKVLPERRIKRAQLRPFLLRLSYEIVGGKDLKSIASSLTAMEFQNIYFYIHNWVFDNKEGVWHGKQDKIRKKVNNLIISGAIFREVIQDLLEKDIQKSNIKRKEIIDGLIKCNTDVYRAQFLDTNILTIDRISKFRSDKIFLDEYTNRSKLLSGSFYGFTAMVGAILGGGTKKQIDIMYKFGEALGTGGQMSNDLGDFLPPKRGKETFGKSYKDQMSDLIEGKLTLPIYYILKYGEEKQKKKILKLVGKSNPSIKEMKDVAKIINSSESYRYSYLFFKKYYRDAINILHKSFPESETRSMLSIMASAIKTNKFLVELKKY